MENRIFKCESNNNLIFNCVSYLRDYIGKDDYDYFVSIGSDSQQSSACKYTIAIAVHKVDPSSGVGKGAHVIHWSERTGKEPSVLVRLWGEVNRLIEVALELRDGGIEPEIHFDLNRKDTEESNKVYTGAIGYAQGLGFVALGKPDAPVATYAANRYCRM